MPASREWRPGQIWSTVSRQLLRCYSDLRAHFGYHPCWWPGNPWEIALSAMLVQQCDWTVAHRAVQNLTAAGYTSPRILAEANVSRLLPAMASVSLAPTKASRLITFARQLTARGVDDLEHYLNSTSTEVLRFELLQSPGIGHETADAMLLFAGSVHPTFIIDAYTRRIFARYRLLPGLSDRFWRQSTPVLRLFLQEHLLSNLACYAHLPWEPGVSREVALLRDFHAQLVELGRHHCLKNHPLCRTQGKHGWTDYPICREHCTAENCSACPLSPLCRHFRDSPSARSPRN